MDEVIMLLGEKPREILSYAQQNRIPAYMSYCIEQRWHRSRVFIEDLADDSVDVAVRPRMSCSQPDIQQGQHIGISFQCGQGESHDRFIFGSTVVSVQAEAGQPGWLIGLAMPEEIEVVRNKSYFRCMAPDGLNVGVEMWQRQQRPGRAKAPAAHICQGWAGRLIELGADSLSVAVSELQGPDLKKGDYLGLRFIPLDNETPLTFNACVKHIIPTREDRELWLDMEIIGLEASPEGRLVLRRLCNVVSLYRRQRGETDSAEQNTATLTASVIDSWLY